MIVKFKSRMVKECILKNVKHFKGSKLYITEDLTSMNFLVLNCVKKKMPDEVNAAWFINGKICYENKAGNVHVVQFNEYE